jgi:predicted GNAT family acetyltransferase
MSTDANEVIVINNEAAQRFEIQIEKFLAVAQYERDGTKIIFTHTIVPRALEGHGIASKLIQTALQTAREQHLSVVPLCPFVVAYLQRHQEYLDIVEPDYQERLRRS